MFGLFGSKPKPDELLKKWQNELRREQRTLDRDIRNIERDEAKLKQQIKQSAAKGDVKSAKIMAKSVARARGTMERLHVTKTQINSVAMQLKEQQSMVKVVGAIQQSTQVMQMMGRLVSIPKLNAVTRTMAMEMERAGLISEIVNDTFDMVDDENVEEEADAQVNKVLYELTEGKLGSLEAAPASKQKQEDEKVDDMVQRLAQLGAT